MIQNVFEHSVSHIVEIKTIIRIWSSWGRRRFYVELIEKKVTNLDSNIRTCALAWFRRGGIEGAVLRESAFFQIFIGSSTSGTKFSCPFIGLRCSLWWEVGCCTNIVLQKSKSYTTKAGVALLILTAARVREACVFDVRCLFLKFFFFFRKR